MPGSIRGALLALGFLAPQLTAQELRVRVADPGAGGRLVVGALTTLASDSNPIAAIGVTNELGRVRLRAPAGSYRLTIERPGYVDTSYAVAIGATVDSILVRHASGRPAFPSALAPIPARCTTPGVPAQGRALWTEARRTLRIVAASEQLELLSMSLASFERSYSTAMELRNEQLNTLLGTANRPPATRPGSELWHDGFLGRGDSLTWFAPEVATFLAPEFESGHCFGVVAGSETREGLLGLRFVPTDPARVDLTGTFWLDPTSRELTVIDYGYIGVIKDWRPERLGGSIEIHRMDPGVWVSRFWFQRTPVVTGLQGGGKGRLQAFREQGAEVTRVSIAVDTTDRIATSLAIRQQLEAGRRRIARMTGLVIDTLGYPVPDAEVAVLGTEYQATTDKTGAFTLDGLPLGLQIARVRKVGYKVQHLAIRFAAGEEWTGKVTIKRLPTILGEIVVVGKWGKPPKYANTSKYDEFYRRRSGRSGRYITREDIDARPVTRITELLTTTPGVRVGFDRPGGDDVEFVGCSAGAAGIWIDGQRMNGNFGELLRVITPRDIEAVEIYVRETQIPAEFRDGSCAAIIMWTRWVSR